MAERPRVRTFGGMPPRPASVEELLPVPVAPLRSPWSLRERLARHAVLLVLTVLDLVAGAFLAVRDRASEVLAGAGIDPGAWWQPLAGRVVVVVVVWAVVVQLPVGPIRSARVVQFLSLATAASVALSALLLAVG